MEGFCPLASGSKGNALYLGTKKTKILIDCGLSAKATGARLEAIGVSLDDIDAILITHEHTDHIAGLKNVAMKRNIPIIANRETAKGIVSALRECPTFKIFTTGEPFTFGDLQILPFTIPHDTPDPCAFTIRIDGMKLGICADLGYVTSHVRYNLKECDYLYIESNHEPSMVHASARPIVYKQRVLGKSGHLSNQECAGLVAEIFHPALRHIHLAHLSQECNHPDTALRCLHEKLGKTDCTIAIAPQETLGDRVFF